MIEKKIRINGNELSGEHLYKEANSLIGIKHVIDSNKDTLDIVNYLYRDENMIAVNYFIQDGVLEKLSQSLSYVSEQLESISNNICPDETEEELICKK